MERFVKKLKTPPAVSGSPLLGHMLDFRNDPVELFCKGYEQNDEIISVSVASKPGAVPPDRPCSVRYRRREQPLGIIDLARAAQGRLRMN
jgi:hypothetical protein